MISFAFVEAQFQFSVKLLTCVAYFYVIFLFYFSRPGKYYMMFTANGWILFRQDFQQFSSRRTARENFPVMFYRTSLT
jgi:hypothetical protein